MQLAVDSIRTDGGTQSRAQINWLTVTDYAADIAEGATFPPVVVYFDGADYWLADGFHRLEAHKRLGLVEIAADVKQGTRRDAILYSVKANAIHGLRRTNDDKRRAVRLLLEDDEWWLWNDVKIASMCGVSSMFVGNVRREVKKERDAIIKQFNDDLRLVERNGTTYTIDTANIGKRAEPVDEPDAQGDLLAAPVVDDDDEPATPEPEPVVPSLSIVPPAPPEFRILHGDMREVMAAMEPGSIDVIITDPPYPREFVPLYGDLARLAAHVLKPGGSLLAMAGQSYIPDLLALMTPHLRYHWTVAYMTPGQSTQIFPRRVMPSWKPVFWFVNGDYDGPWHGDVINSAANDKRFHHWGQSESGMGALIERFTDAGDVILDPFCGGGTTGKVALDLGRGFIGIDTDTAHIATSLRRMGEVYAASQAGA